MRRFYSIRYEVGRNLESARIALIDLVQFLEVAMAHFGVSQTLRFRELS